MRERGGTPFRQIFWIRNGAPANIVGHIGGKLTLKRSGKSRRSVYFLAQIAPKRGILHQKSPKNFPRVTPRYPLIGRGDPLLHPLPARLHAVRAGRGAGQAPALLGPRSRKAFPPNQNLPLHPRAVRGRAVLQLCRDRSSDESSFLVHDQQHLQDDCSSLGRIAAALRADTSHHGMRVIRLLT